MVLVALASPCFGQSFESPVTYPVGNGPSAVAVGDLNNDGKLDLAVTNANSQSVSVLIGNGDGTFAPKVDYVVGGSSIGIIVVDVNADGKGDLATANNTSNLSNVSVLLGNGDGTFQAKTDYAIPSSSFPNAIVGGDLNGDNRPDLITVNEINGATVFLNNGDGTFASPVTIAIGQVSKCAVLADFNGDGKRDLAVGVFGPANLKVLLGNGNGTFQTAVDYQLGLTALNLATQDLNGDSKLDLVAGNFQSAGLSVVLGNGDGTFGPPTIYPAASAWKSISLADFNGDSKTDVALTSVPSGLMVFPGNGDGSFRKSINFTTGALYAAAGDFNGDNKPDLATTNGPTGSSLDVLINVTGPHRISGRVTDGTNIGMSPVSVTLIGLTPMVAATEVDGTYSFTGLPSGANVLVTPSRPNFTFVPTNRSFNNLSSDQIADFNGYPIQHVISGVVRNTVGVGLPGVAVILFAFGASSTITTVTGSDGGYTLPAVPAGNNYLVTASLPGFEFPSVPVNNLAGPRTVNFVASPVITVSISGTAPTFSSVSLTGSAAGLQIPFSGNYSFSPLTPGGTYTVSATAIQPGAHFSKFLMNSPSSQTFPNLNSHATFNFSGTQLQFGPVVSPRGLVTADFNSDGRPDLAVTNFGINPVVRIFAGQPDGSLQFSQQTSLACEGLAPLTADFNNDGKKDLAFHDTCTNNVNVLLGNGDATFQPIRSFTLTHKPLSVAVGDFNNDNKLDLCVVIDVASNNRSLTILQGAGDGNFTVGTPFSTGVAAGFATAADLNSDGNTDLVTVTNQQSLSVFLGNGNGTFQSAVSVSAGSNPILLDIGDLNGDLKPDIVVSNNAFDTVSILIGNGSGGFAAPSSIGVCHLPSSVKLADFNADAKLDIVTGCDSNHLSSILGNGDGTFQAPVGNEAGSSLIAVADFNADAKLDVAILEAVGLDRILTTLRNVIPLGTPPTISGQIKNADNSPAAGVDVTLTPARQAPITTTTDANGNYSFPNLVYGNHFLVRPSKTYFSFSPAAQAFQDVTQNQVANFTATRNTPSIVGRVTDFNGAGVSGVTVTLTGSQSASTTTTANGTYSFANLLAGGNYVVTPTFSSGTFTPASRTHNDLSVTTVSDFRSSLTRTIQFTAVSYEVTEGSPSINVTLTRAGNTAGPAKVEYQTIDNPAEVRCDAVNGIAFARCDYATTIETVSFAAGESTKTLSIPIIDDAFAEGDEKFSIFLTNPSDATLGLVSSVTLTIKDNDLTNGPNPIFNTPFFVRQHYLDFLSREPEPGEPWTALLNNCSDVNNNPQCDRLTVSAAFFGSQEFQLKGYFVYRFYKVAFNRLPLYAEIASDMRAVTGQTPDEVFQKKGDFTRNFSARPDFLTDFNSVTNAQYVSMLMGRYSLTSITTPDPAAPDGTNKVTLTAADLTNSLNAGSLTRGQVLRAIADSDQVFSAEFYAAFVAMQYYGYLRRTPESTGFNAWLDYLNAHPSDFRTMVNGFMNSIEYRLRFGPSN